jgi:hypothetical protein
VALIHSTKEGNTMKANTMGKSAGLRIAAATALVFGLGLGASAFAADPDCINACLEIKRDCIAQAGGGSIQHCNRAYRECAAGCEF